MNLQVCIPKETSRARYALQLVLEEILGLSVSWTTEPAVDQPLLVYGRESTPDGIYFPAANLLFESSVEEQRLSVARWEGLPIFFQVADGPLPFDPFAAAFYLVSRYEEYLPHKRDKFGRYDPSESLAVREGFIREPVVNQWALKVKEVLDARFPGLTYAERSYQYVPTIDVDNAYAYLEKGLARTVGAYGKALLKGDLKGIAMRSQCLMGLKADPFDTFGHLLELQRQYNFKPVYFFLVADYGPNDKNVPVSSRKFQSLIKSVFDYADVGLHPSYMSNKEPHRLKMELDRLGGVLHVEVKRSRQHFLKFRLPDTYRSLIDLGVTDEYSMGFPDVPGFRAGICQSFLFYDLDREQTTDLRVHPFCLMEATYRHYLKQTPEQALEAITELIETIKSVNGTFMPLWHNDSVGGTLGWEGWADLFEHMTQRALPA